MLLILIIFVELINGIYMTNQFIEEPEDIETIIGSTIILRCRTEPIHQTQVNWCKNDFCTLGKTRDLPFYPRYQIIGHAHQGEHHFKIVNVSLEDNGMYQCQIQAGPRRSGSMSRKAKLTVLQIPTSLSIDNPIILIENVLSFIICRGDDGMPEAKLSWHIPKSINYLSINDYVLLSGQSLRNSISNLTLIPNRSYHGILIQCQAHSSAILLNNKTMITQQYIQTIFRPEINISLIGQQIENKIITIQCYVNSRPKLIKIEWFNGTDLLNVTNENRLSFILTRYMHKNKITCQATNQVGKTNQSIELYITYKPIFIDKYGNKLNNYSVVLVNEGESIELECFIDSSPSSLITWIFNNKIISINKTFFQIDYIQTIQHIGIYICSAHHSFFGTFNRTIRLALKGPPEMIEDKIIDSVYVGQSVILVCSISKDIPIQEIYWSREDQSKIISNEKYEINENESDNIIKYKLLIKNVLLSDNGYYICTGINQYGSSITKYQLRVIHINHLLIRPFFLYGSIIIGIFISFILIILALINNYQQKKTKRIRKKSSTTDETISSLTKQQEYVQHDYQDEPNSIIDQQFIHNHTNDIFDSCQHDLFYFENNSKRYSTVV
ncbi:unnamed protein product [Rotaria sordida]|uniref:Ig-like domain-containing protein n=1 Tax=Rotaria sordida TaxID=392033 RepID=A0A814U7V5_9BILA|nr:unnamed protein product [Rotaria sordida]